MGAFAAAVLTGLLLAFSFPPFGAAPIAWGALVPLLLAIAGAPGGGFRLGFTAGMVFRLVSMPWVMSMVHAHAGASRAASGGAFLLLAAYLAGYTGLFACALRRAVERFGPPGVLLAPALWAALEWANARLFTGFHWNPLSAGQAHLPWLAGAARAAGAPGLSFLVVLVNAALVLPLARRSPARAAPRALLLAAALLSLLPLSGVGRRAPGGPGAHLLRIRLVNPAVPREAKWTLPFQREALRRLGDLSRSTRAGTDLVLWPETAVPFHFDANAPAAAAVGTLARSLRAGILFGAPGRRRVGEGIASTNSVFLVDRDGALAGRYDKRRRVPFGEYVPLRFLVPFLSPVATGTGRGDLAGGVGPGVLGFEGLRLGPLVCYEALFSDLASETTAAGAGVLVNFTNDAWLGRAGAAQHFAMARLRAVEEGVPLVRVANRGTSAVVDAAGRAHCVLAAGAAGATDCTLRLRDGRVGRPPLQRAFGPACALLALAALLSPIGRGARARSPGGAGDGRL